MKKSSIIFLQVVIVALGIGALALLLWEPHVEGRNAHATLYEMYFTDPFLAYVYIASIPFFVALYQALKLLSYIGQNKAFSQAAVKTLQATKYCGLVLVGLIVVSLSFMIFGDKDDRPAGLFMRLMATFISVVIATTAAVFEKLLQTAVEMKSALEYKK